MWWYNTEIDFREAGCEDVDCIYLAEDRVKETLVNTITMSEVP
jgi:hypothetical protein